MHVGVVGRHVDDDGDDLDVEVATRWSVEDDDGVVVEDADSSGHDTLGDTR